MDAGGSASDVRDVAPEVACVESGPEVCDGEDNDCNGTIDDVQGSGCIGGEGACRREGTLVCGEGGALVCDVVPGTPTAEMCNGLDDDCDGERDEIDGEEPACAPLPGAVPSPGARAPRS